MLLDEATSALDAALEAEILSALLDEWREKAVVSITHRLQTVALYDYVYLMEGGVIVEHGSAQDYVFDPAQDALVRRSMGEER
ncbi:MAG: hypothetical protein RR482_05925 [Clostridia bacterium]